MKKGFVLIATLLILSVIMLTLFSLTALNLTSQKRVMLYQQNLQELYAQRAAASAKKFYASGL